MKLRKNRVMLKKGLAINLQLYGEMQKVNLKRDKKHGIKAKK